MASGSNHNQHHHHPTSGPSGRSPFPAARGNHPRARTRLARPSFEGVGGTAVLDESHSPFLQGLLRFSPTNTSSNNANTSTASWSPHPVSSKQQAQQAQTGRSKSFFGERTGDGGDTSASSSALADDSQLSERGLPTGVVDGIPLSQVRALAQESVRETTSSFAGQAVFYASLVYSKTQHPTDALLLASAHMAGNSAATTTASGNAGAAASTGPSSHVNSTACLRILEESGLLQSTAPWQGLLLACSALAAAEEWPSVVQLLDDACRLPAPVPVATENWQPNATAAGASSFAALAAVQQQLQQQPMLSDHDDFGWHKLQQVIGHAQQEHDQALGNNYSMPGSGNHRPIHWLARIAAWRGLAHYHTGHAARAKLYWKRALQTDSRCQQAWEWLLDKHLMTATEAYECCTGLLEFTPDQAWLQAAYLARIETTGTTTTALPSSAAAAPSNSNLRNTVDDQHYRASFGDASAILPLASPLVSFQTPAGVSLADPTATTHLQGGGDEENNNVKPSTSGDTNPTTQQELQLAAQMQKDVDTAFDQLWNTYKLHHSPYVLAMAARRAHRRYDYPAALQYCQRLAQLDPMLNGASYVYLSTLTVLGHKRVLFSTAHEWVTARPKSCQAWFAVGCYYYSCQRYHVAQRHFCRATRLDPACTAAWIAFGVAFCACDESDQALASFRAAQRLAPGEHTSLLYMGMEYVRTNHLVLAHYFLQSAATASAHADPLCWHELGVWHAAKGEPDKAVPFFERALVTAVCCTSCNSSTAAVPSVEESLELIADGYWEPTVFGLGHMYRKTRQFDKALQCFLKCMALAPATASTYAAAGFTLHLQHDLDGAADYYHQALAIKQDDPFATEMLQRALQELSTVGMPLLDDDNHMNTNDGHHKRRQQQRNNNNKSRDESFASSSGWKEGDSSAMSMDVDMSADDSRTTP